MALPKETLDRIIELATPDIHVVGDYTYSDRVMKRIEPPAHVHALLTVRTLTGLVAALPYIGDEGEKVIIHVQSHLEVAVQSQGYDDELKRPYFMRAVIPAADHRFGNFLSHEDFIIWLQSMFTPAGDRDALVRLAGSLTAEAIRTSDDDGISQVAGTKVGVSLKNQSTVKPRVVLTPYRTFRDAVQPPSEFLVRLSGQNDGTPKIGLFEADGGTWQNDAAENVAAKIWNLLGEKASEYPIIR